MTNGKKPAPTKKVKAPPKQPPMPDLESLWGDLPVDDDSEMECLAQIITRGGRRLSDPAAFRKDILLACHNTYGDLHERVRVKVRKDAIKGTAGVEIARAALDELEGHLGGVLNALECLGYDASKELRRHAEAQATPPEDDCGGWPWQWLEPRGFAPSGDTRLEWVERVVAEARVWAQQAAVGLGKPQHASAALEARKLVRDLVQLWTDQTGEAPTLITDDGPDKRVRSGDFLEFCERIVHGVWDAAGLDKPSVYNHINDLLYRKGAA